ncbi:MAG TPA: RNA 2',3'-cyclic phosphodiesterase [Natronosporangium sp.]|nr:RNA 2',3'-cyclic phosphodiesterase [Natronosporangium sp.]
MRLFVAVYPTQEALADLAAAVSRLRLGAAAASGVNVRLTARPLWHVTLAFLGEVAEERVSVVGQAVREGVQSWVAAGGRPPALRLAGAGRFGRRRFTVVWVGLRGDVDQLRSLGDAVRAHLRRRRVAYDPKPLRPHLTFARPGDRLPEADLAADLATLSGYEGPGWTVDEVYLVRSHPGPRPVHERLVGVSLR